MGENQGSGGRTTFPDQFDVTKKEREVIDFRHARRLKLRAECQRLMLDPNYRNHVVSYFCFALLSKNLNFSDSTFVFQFDSAIQRQYTAVFAYDSVFKAKFKNFAWVLGMVAVPYLILYKIVKAERVSS